MPLQRSDKGDMLERWSWDYIVVDQRPYEPSPVFRPYLAFRPCLCEAQITIETSYESAWDFDEFLRHEHTGREQGLDVGGVEVLQGGVGRDPRDVLV